MVSGMRAADAAFGFFVERGAMKIKWQFVQGRLASHLCLASGCCDGSISRYGAGRALRAGRCCGDLLDADRRLFDRRSGFHGNMFPVDKLEGAMIRLADDIRQHYDLVLTGDEATWRRLDSVDTGTRSAFRIPD
jgi:hypothetical protein